MSKRTNGWTEEKIARYYAEGRGKGELASYKPWLTIQNVPSSGRVHRFKGWKTNRIVSDLKEELISDVINKLKQELSLIGTYQEVNESSLANRIRIDTIQHHAIIYLEIYKS
ncbi:hypothetical protein [Metabacillus arenae]|uniref:hypothetical protein n=1 Tax=Metabacillus arenae TaxID=2771434 RepID=UPI001CD0707C|nr:hypothetical protein [Metabacillus arenae]